MTSEMNSHMQECTPTYSCLKGSKVEIGCTFSDALDYNLAFIDKSLIAEAVINCGSRAVLLTAPRRMGKSFCMNILREFFSFCDAGGKERSPEERFKNLKIMEPDIFHTVKEHMGQYPVVYLHLDYKRDLRTLDDVKSIFGGAVFESYRDHLYLFNNDANLVEQYQHKSTLDNTLDGALKTLTELLCNHHKRKCIFIADGYDTILTQIAKSIFDGSEIEAVNKSALLKDASHFILGALDRVIKHNNENVRFAIMTGISDVASPTESGALNDVTRHRFLESPIFFKFFGFLEEEFNEVMSKFKSGDSKIEECKLLYNGYRFIDEGITFSIYNPWVTFKFAITKPSTSPPQAWCETGVIGVTTNICKIKSVRNDILKLLGGDGLRFIPENKITYQDLITLSKMHESRIDHDKVSTTNLYYTHLLNQGYLTVTERKEEWVVAVIPNDEIKNEFRGFLRKHTESEFGINFSPAATCAELVFEILKLLRQNDETTKIEEKLKELYNNLKHLYSIDKTNTSINEFVINCVSYFIGNYMTKNEKGLVKTQYYSNDGVNKGYLDVAYSYENCAIIVENKLNASVEEAVGQILDRNYLSSFPYSKFILIGTTFNHSSSKKYELAYLLNSKKIENLKTLK